MRRTATWIGVGVALMLAACAEPAPTGSAEARALTTEAPVAEAPRAASPTVDGERLARLEARLEETELRLREAEARALAAEIRAADPARARPAVADPTFEARSEDEIKAAASGVDDGASGPLPVPEPAAYDDRLDPHKAAAFNVDPLPDD